MNVQASYCAHFEALYMYYHLLYLHFVQGLLDVYSRYVAETYML